MVKKFSKLIIQLRAIYIFITITHSISTYRIFLRLTENIFNLLSFSKTIHYLMTYLAEKIVNYYMNAIPVDRRGDHNLLSRTIGTALGDYYISCPSHHFADYVLRNSQNCRVYQYYWTYRGDPKSSAFWRTFEEVWCGKWMGSCHSFELYAIFGIPFLQSIAFNEMDRRMSSKIITIVSQFAYNK